MTAADIADMSRALIQGATAAAALGLSLTGALAFLRSL